MQPRIQPADVGVITRGGATIGDDSPLPQIRLVARNKVKFDVNTEKITFLNVRDVIKMDTGKFPIHEIPPDFDSTLVEGPSCKVGTLQSFLEIFLSLEKVPNVLAEIASLLY